MLMGEYHHSIDDKGRLTIPSKVRYDLGENFIVTRGLDNCLFVYPKEEWNNIINKYKELPNTKDARNFMRFFLSVPYSIYLKEIFFFWQMASSSSSMFENILLKSYLSSGIRQIYPARDLKYTFDKFSSFLTNFLH